MTSQFSVVIDGNDLARAKSGALTGRVWVRLDGEAFPEEQWSDFPAIALKDWLTEMRSLLEDDRHVASCHFVDGPYLFRLTYRDAKMWGVDLIERGLKGEVCMVSAEISADEILAETLSGAQMLLTSSNQLRLSGEDLRDLSQVVSSLSSRVQGNSARRGLH